MKAALVGLLLGVAGCVQVDKRITVINLAPCTATTIEAIYESDTSTDAKPKLQLDIPLLP